MTVCRRTVLAVLMLLPVPVLAQDAGLWGYGCDHYLHGACIRLPNGMAVGHQVPADFDLHTLTSNGREVLTIYEGDAPQRPSSSAVPDIALEIAGHRLRGYKTVGGDSVTYDVYVDSVRPGDMVLHMRGVTHDADQQKDLAAALGGFRVCNFKKSQHHDTLVCPRRGPWGAQLGGWVVAEQSQTPLK